MPDKIINDSVPNERRRVGESVVNSKSPIDATAIINLRDEGDDLLADLINLFLSETPKRLGKIERGLASADWQTVRIAAHTLRGTGATFGAARMRELARQIELARYPEAVEEMVAVLQQLRTECEQVQDCLIEEKAKSPAD